MTLDEAVEKYIKHKRECGLAYRNQASELRTFLKSIGPIDVASISTSQILTFLNSRQISTYTWRRKYAQLGNLFEHWHTMGEIPTVQMPSPRGLVRPSFVPYVYSRAEVNALLRSAVQIKQNAAATIPPETLRTILLFVYATGARTKEATSLLAEDVNFRDRTLRFRQSGYRSIRNLPLGRDLGRAMVDYCEWKRSMNLHSPSFFVRWDGNPVQRDALYDSFRKLLQSASITRRDGLSSRPRICDLRTTFAVHQITTWIRGKKDLNRLLPALAAYLGQIDICVTERFLMLTPDRFKSALNKLSPKKDKRWSLGPEAFERL